MRIHTDTLTADDFPRILRECQDAGLVDPAVTIDVLTEHRSRSRRCAFEVSMGCPSGTPRYEHPAVVGYLAEWHGMDHGDAKGAAKRAGIRRARSGYRASTPDVNNLGATWHEWGFFLNALWEADQNLAIPGVYRDRHEFERMTDGSAAPHGVVRHGRAMGWSAYREYADAARDYGLAPA